METKEKIAEKVNEGIRIKEEEDKRKKIKRKRKIGQRIFYLKYFYSPQ